MTPGDRDPDSDPEPEPEPEPETRRRGRDFWQLHLPLAIVLVFCTAATVIEARRATEGVWRAWAYMFEWPLIGLFCIWIWNRYRKHGTIIKGLADRWRAHAASYGASDESDPESASTPAPKPDTSPLAIDPDLAAWRGYVDDLHRREPPGAPPAS